MLVNITSERDLLELLEINMNCIRSYLKNIDEACNLIDMNKSSYGIMKEIKRRKYLISKMDKFIQKNKEKE